MSSYGVFPRKEGSSIKIIKRILALALILTALLPTVLVVPSQADQWNSSQRSEVHSAVSKVIKDYAVSIYQDSVASSAVQDMTMHAMFKNGAYLTLKEGDAMVSALFNANLFQVASIDGITDSILTMQKYCEPALFVRGGPSWHIFNDTFSYGGYIGTKRDYSHYIGTISSCELLYGSNTFNGEQNANDTAMQIIVGGLSYTMLITQGEVKNGKVVYNIRMNIWDNFEFNSDYSKAEEKGYDPSLDQSLVRLGRLLEKFAITTFEWEFTKDFQIEVPYPCDHQTGSYSWELDTDTMTMRSITDGFQDNKATTITGVSTSSGKEYRYYQLEKTIQLKHDKPWVLEYEGSKIKSLAFTPSDKGRPSMPFLRHSSTSYVWVQKQEYIPTELNDNGTATKSTYIYHYWAATIKDAFKYYSKHTYTYRLENVPAANGSNMVYLSIYDHDLGEQVLAPTPVNDYMIMNKGEEERTLISEEDNGISGKDLVINNIGNSGQQLNVGSLKVRIWENGQENIHDSYWDEKTSAPTCTADGYTQRKCSRCGLTQRIAGEAATGHHYGEWTQVLAPGCGTAGRLERRCSGCGDTQQQEIAAMTHAFGDYVSDENATCTKDGTLSAICQHCGTKDTQENPGSVLGHNMSAWATTLAPTCETAGQERTACIREGCGYEETRDLAALGHSMSPWTTTVKAGCETEGQEISTCSREGCTREVTQPLAPTGHDHKAQTTPPTCTSQGFTIHICANCGNSYTDSYTEPQGHTWKNPNAIHLECVTCGYGEGGFPVTMAIPEEMEMIPQEIYADGVSLPLEQKDGQLLVWLPHEQVTNLVLCTTNDTGTEDVHTQYPSSMRVWTLKYENDAYTATYIPEFDNLLTYAGCSIRITGVKGIRMITSINKDTKNALTGKGLAGYKLVEYGTALAWASEIDPSLGLTLGQEWTKSNYAYKKGVADPVYNRTADAVQYTNVLVGFDDDQCIPDIAMRPYIILEDAAGTQITIYGGTIYRSIGYIAWQNRNAFAPISGSYGYVWSNIHHVYGDQFDAEYKG